MTVEKDAFFIPHYARIVMMVSNINKEKEKSRCMDLRYKTVICRWVNIYNSNARSWCSSFCLFIIFRGIEYQRTHGMACKRWRVVYIPFVCIYCPLFSRIMFLCELCSHVWCLSKFKCARANKTDSIPCDRNSSIKVFAI